METQKEHTLAHEKRARQKYAGLSQGSFSILWAMRVRETLVLLAWTHVKEILKEIESTKLPGQECVHNV